MEMEKPQNTSPGEENEPQLSDLDALTPEEREKRQERAKQKYIELNKQINYLESLENPDLEKIKELEGFRDQWAEVAAGNK